MTTSNFVPHQKSSGILFICVGKLTIFCWHNKHVVGSSKSVSVSVAVDDRPFGPWLTNSAREATAYQRGRRATSHHARQKNFMTVEFTKLEWNFESEVVSILSDTCRVLWNETIVAILEKKNNADILCGLQSEHFRQNDFKTVAAQAASEPASYSYMPFVLVFLVSWAGLGVLVSSFQSKSLVRFRRKVFKRTYLQVVQRISVTANARRTRHLTIRSFSKYVRSFSDVPQLPGQWHRNHLATCHWLSVQIDSKFGYLWHRSGNWGTARLENKPW